MALPLLILARGGLAAQPVAARYAYGHGGGQHRLLSGTMAIGLTGGVFALLVAGLVLPQVIPAIDPPITVDNIPIDQPPPPQPPATQPPKTPTSNRITTVPPHILIDIATGPIIIPGPIADPFPTTDPGPDFGPPARPADPPAHLPVLTDAARDPRFIDRFQPEYPAAMIRADREGVCRVSVTIAPSGRVSAVRQLACDDPAFFRATERQALSQWRFHPATRDGVAVESTLEQTVRFQLPE